MGIEKKFGYYVDDWKMYCKRIKYSSNHLEYERCEAFNDIIRLGKRVLPLIKEIYSGNDEEAFFPILGWTSIVEKIIGKDFKIPQNIMGNVRAIRDYTVRWLEENMDKYLVKD